MTKQKASALVICALLVGTFLLLCVVSSAKSQQEPKANWSDLKIVTYASGLTGFFDPNSGKLYVYDSNLENCFVVRQLIALGKPMKKLKN
jgi:hypothetical protein